MEKIIYIITSSGYDYNSDYREEILAVCDNKEDAERALIFYRKKNYNCIDILTMPIQEFKDENTKIYYEYNVCCEIKDNKFLESTHSYFSKYTDENTDKISWINKRSEDGTNAFTIYLTLHFEQKLKNCRFDITKKMIKDKIFELSNGEIKLEDPFEGMEII